MNALAEGHGVAPAAIALAALNHHPTDQQVFPIIGASRPDQLRDALRAQEVALSPEEWSDLEHLSRPEKIFPYSLIDTEMGRRVTSGGEPDRLIRRDLTGFSR